MRLVAINGSPSSTGKTRTMLEAIIAGTNATDWTIVHLLDAGREVIDAALAIIRDADTYIFASPVHRASFSLALKTLLDQLPRGMWGETEAPLRGRAIAIGAVGGTTHHFLALNDLRSVLAGFFGAHVVPPGVYVPAEGIDSHHLVEPYAGFAYGQGEALRELSDILASSRVLQDLVPQV